jgi:hypothetical protein
MWRTSCTVRLNQVGVYSVATNKKGVTCTVANRAGASISSKAAVRGRLKLLSTNSNRSFPCSFCSKNSRETTGPKLGFKKFENPVRFFAVDKIACRAYEI